MFGLQRFGACEFVGGPQELDAEAAGGVDLGPNQPLARVSATAPPSEWPSTTTLDAGGMARAMDAAKFPNEYRDKGA